MVVLFPFHIPIYLPRTAVNAFFSSLRALRVLGPPPIPDHDGPDDHEHGDHGDHGDHDHGHGARKFWAVLRFPMNFVTAPIIADLFLLAILAIGRDEVYDGTVGSKNIHPIDIMVFFITLAYIAISIDASGLIRYLAFKVLQMGGQVGHRLFFSLYAFFFILGTFIGNDPIILSGTAFLAYMTRVANNITHPRAWIYTQFAIANIASAILVSSNPTNLVLAGAFQIKFIVYSAYMIVPVVATAVVLFPFLLYFVFADENLIPASIKMHKLPQGDKAKRPVNPNIPHGRGVAEENEENLSEDNQAKLSLEEIMNPFLDKGGAAFGAFVMATALITLLALNAASQTGNEHPVYWVTLPAAFVLFCWDVTFGWIHRKETREIARRGQEEVQRARAERMVRKAMANTNEHEVRGARDAQEPPRTEGSSSPDSQLRSWKPPVQGSRPITDGGRREDDMELATYGTENSDAKPDMAPAPHVPRETMVDAEGREPATMKARETEHEAARQAEHEADFERRVKLELEKMQYKGPRTLQSITRDLYQWAQETFPTVTAVLAHLPFALVPFALAMFVLVQALVTKNWVAVFAYGWDHWVNKTGTVGAIGGMGFLGVLLCNVSLSSRSCGHRSDPGSQFAGTNIGTTILLSRVIQTWIDMHERSGDPISDRTFWAAVYAMALGVNYGAFSLAFSAALAGMLWRDILARKHIRVRQRDFARINLPIIAIAMTIGCIVLVGEMYIIKGTGPASVMVTGGS